MRNIATELLNMKRAITLVVATVVITLSGCINIVEKLTLNKDGTGHYQFTMDLGEMFSEDFRDFMLIALEDEGADMPDEFPVIDSVMYYKDNVDIAKFARPEVIESAYMHMQVNEKKGLFDVTIHMDFDKVDDIDYFMDHLGELGGGGMTDGMSDGLIPSVADGALFELKGKKLVRNMSEVEPATGEDMDMMLMMMGANTYDVIYELPGKVKNTTIANAKVDGKTVTVEHSIADVLTGKVRMDGEIKYK